jgi:hypothetical protein
MQQYGIEAVPLQHEMMDEWRENFKGVQYVHAPTNLLVTGAVDDLWQNPDGEIIVVDYKATSKNGEVSLDAEWQMGYKRQMEVYQWLMRNTSVSASTLKYLKSEDGIGPGIERLVQSITYNFMSPGTSTSPEPVFAGVERLVFYNDYPIFDDENNLSMVLFLKCYGTGVMFTGDLEKDGFAALLRNDALFKQALRETNVYIAPHHGRENGCSEYILPYLTNVYYVVISDKGYMYDTQQTMPFYSRIAKGGPFRGTTRKILTTRNDGRIGFTFSVNSWGPY